MDTSTFIEGGNVNLMGYISLTDVISLIKDRCFNITLNKSIQVKNDTLYFDASGKFKIVQFADIQDGPETDPRTINLMNRILDKEKPNLVVLSGDNIDGKCKSKEDVKKAISNIAAPMETRGIPWAIVFGNHDDEHFMMNKSQMMEFYLTFKHNISQVGYRTDNRIGNYNLFILARKSKTPMLNLYFLDSGKYSIVGIYDYIIRPQISWYKSLAKSLIKQYRKTIPALMFFHIPLQEFKTAYDTGYIEGVRLEDESPSTINSGMFDTVLKTGDVKGIFVGHDHKNTYTALLKGIRLSYAGSAGYGTYGDSRLQRGARIIEINEINSEDFKTRMVFSGDVGMS